MATPRQITQSSTSVTQNAPNPTIEWFNNPWKTTFTALGSIVFLIGVGYAIASHTDNADFKIQKIELKQEYSEKLQNAINDCRDGKIAKYQDEIKEIKETVNNLKNSK